MRTLTTLTLTFLALLASHPCSAHQPMQPDPTPLNHPTQETFPPAAAMLPVSAQPPRVHALDAQENSGTADSAAGLPADMSNEPLHETAARAGIPEEEDGRSKIEDGAPTSNSELPSSASPRWQRIAREYSRLKELHPDLTLATASLYIGVPLKTLWNVLNIYAKRGYETRRGKAGSRSTWEIILKDKPFCDKLTELYLATIGASGPNVVAGRRTAKMATALRCMADEPECPPALADKFRRGKFPIPLLRYLKRITPELENRFRGPKHFQLNGLVSRRDQTIRFPDGQRAEMPAGYSFVFDDMSANQPFWTEHNGELLFSRQGLYALDHRSLRWLAHMLVARPRQAYRAEDILRFCRQLFTLTGKPDQIIFERGIWHARTIRGWKLTDGLAAPEEFERPGIAEDDQDNLSRGLEAVGIRVIFATSARGKIIETAFNHFQDVLAVKASAFQNIGRHAGEFEYAAKQMNRARALLSKGGSATASVAGERAPREQVSSHSLASLGFAPMAALSGCIDAAFSHINGKTNSRSEVPDDLWLADLTRRPLPPLTSDDFAVFLPDKRPTTIQGGRLAVQYENAMYDFRADWMADLGTGYKVFLSWDPLAPELGAAVYNRQDGPANFNRYTLGQFLGIAAWEIPGPAADVTGPVRGVEPKKLAEFYPGATIDQGDTIRRKQSRLVSTQFSAMPRPGQPKISSSPCGIVRRDVSSEAGDIPRGKSRVPSSELDKSHPSHRSHNSEPGTRNSEPSTRRAAPLSRCAADDPALRELMEEDH